MAAIGNATPLIALDAVVIDSETTSLEPAKARVVEIAAVRLVAGRADVADPFRRLVDRTGHSGSGRCGPSYR